MPTWYYGIAAAGCLCALFAPGNRSPYLRGAFWGLITFVAGVTAICAGLYMSWTDVGSATVNEPQGRYFLSILPLLAWIVPAYGPRLMRWLNPLWSVVALLPLLSYSVVPWVIMDRYYGSWLAMGEALRTLLLS